VAEKKIGKLTYRCEQLPAMQTVRMGRRIGNVLGGSLPQLYSVFSLQDEADQNAAAIAAFSAMAANLDERFDDLVRELAEMCQVKWEGQWEDVNVEIEEYVQDAGTLIAIAVFALQTNFKSFFSGPLANLLGNRTPASQKTSSSGTRRKSQKT